MSGTLTRAVVVAEGSTYDELRSFMGDYDAVVGWWFFAALEDSTQAVRVDVNVAELERVARAPRVWLMTIACLCGAGAVAAMETVLLSSIIAGEMYGGVKLAATTVVIAVLGVGAVPFGVGRVRAAVARRGRVCPVPAGLSESMQRQVCRATYQLASARVCAARLGDALLEREAVALHEELLAEDSELLTAARASTQAQAALKELWQNPRALREREDLEELRRLQGRYDQVVSDELVRVDYLAGAARRACKLQGTNSPAWPSARNTVRDLVETYGQPVSRSGDDRGIPH